MDAVKGAGTQKGIQADNSAPEAEKGQEGAEMEATGTLEGLLAAVPEEEQEELRQRIQEMAEKSRMTMEQLAETIRKLAESFAEAWQQVIDRLTPAVRQIAEMLREYIGQQDEWTLAWMRYAAQKAEMSNNERRRKGIPMVRRPKRRRRKE